MDIASYSRKKHNGKPIKKISVYTAIDDFTPTKRVRKFVQVKPFETLGEKHCEWIVENAIRLTEHPTDAEVAFEQTLVMAGVEYCKQTFFRINGNDYFLDFYFPKSKIAIEIDGSIHYTQKTYDKFRDKEFERIGIRTIRIHNSKACLPNILQTVESKYKVRIV